MGLKTDMCYQAVESVQPQTECDRSKLISQYPSDHLYELKRKCNATQDQDVTLLQGELVALLEDHDPFGSTTRWLVDTGSKSVFACEALSFLLNNPTL